MHMWIEGMMDPDQTNKPQSVLIRIFILLAYLRAHHILQFHVIKL